MGKELLSSIRVRLLLLVLLAIPALAGSTGYYFTVVSAALGNVSASWTPPARRNIRISIYAGNPFSGQPNPTATAPPLGALATTPATSPAYP